MWYEIIYETGWKSLAYYDDDEEALSAVTAHHERAKKGEPGRGKSTERNDLADDPQQHIADYPAERIVKVLKYDRHPADLHQDQTMTTEVFTEELANILAGKNVVNLMEVAAEIREMVNPVILEPERHGSMYKMQSVEELALPFGND